MKVFISGPMSGKPYYNRAAFYKAQEDLERHGYSVWNPAWLAYPNDTEFTKDDMHIIDFAALRRCDAIYMLKGWKYSKGAQEEHDYAEMRGLMIMYEGACCWGKEPVFDQEFAYDKAIENRINYQLEAIKENVKEKYSNLDRRIKSIEEELAWDKWKNDLPDICCSNKIDTLCGEITAIDDRVASVEGEVEAIKESIGTDNLQEQLEKDFADVYEEFQNTKDQVNDINMGYIKWSSEVSQFDERIEKLEENMKEIAMNGGLGLSFNLMNARISDNRHRSEEMTRRLDILEASIHKLEEALCEVADDTTLNTSINEKLDEKIAKLQDDLLENTKVIADLAENNIKNRKLETRLANVESEVYNLKSVRTDIYSLGLSIKELKDAVRELETKSKKTKKSDD